MPTAKANEDGGPGGTSPGGGRQEASKPGVKAGATIILTTHDMDEVEKICDRVAIMARGKLVALDSPLALKQQHTERKVDVIRDDGERFVYDLDTPAGRTDLAALVAVGRELSIRTREFDFHATFLKLTGLAFD